MSQFDDETQVEKIDEHRWGGTLRGEGNIGDNPNGGYMACCALRALEAALPHPHPTSVTTHFLRPGIADTPFEVVIEPVRIGRTLSTARARLLQDGKERLEILACFADLESQVGVDVPITVAPPELPEPEHCPLRSEETQGVHLPLLERLEVRLHPEQANAGHYDRAEMSGWIRFRDGRAPCTSSLLLFADAFPPSVLASLGQVGWVPTLELTFHPRRLPVGGWIKARLATDDLHNGRMIETGQLWDASGQLVAQSRQLGLVMHRN